MTRYKRKGAYANRKAFILDDGSIYVICVIDKSSHRRYKKFKKKYYEGN